MAKKIRAKKRKAKKSHKSGQVPLPILKKRLAKLERIVKSRS